MLGVELDLFLHSRAAVTLGPHLCVADARGQLDERGAAGMAVLPDAADPSSSRWPAR